MDDAAIHPKTPRTVAVTDALQFEQLVTERSHVVPVLVDFWANWCGPCHMLAPVLEQLARELGDALALVKVETDQHPDLASRFQIRSLPTIVLFKDGRPVEQMLGVQPAAVIKTMLSKYVVTEADKLIIAAETAQSSGNLEQAKQYLYQVLEKDPGNDPARLRLARLLVKDGALDRARDLLQQTAIDTRRTPEYKAVAAALHLASGVLGARSDDDPDVLLSAVERDPDDLVLRYQLARALAQREQYREALDQLLEIIKRDRDFQDGAARTTMLNIFELLGGKGGMVSHYRGLLARILN